MNNCHLFPIGLLVLAIAAAACTIETADDGPAANQGTSSSSSSSGSSGSVEEDRGEWTDYTPAEISGSESGEFSSSDDVKKFDLPPTDIGGGLLKVTISPANVEVGLWLAQGEKANEQRWEASYLEPEQASGTFYVRLHGSTSYQLQAYPTNFRDGSANPYSVSWEYEPLVDGYEPNDTQEQAKRIPVDNPITAYAHAGIGPDDSRLVGSVADDWYKFDLTENKTIKLNVDRGAEHTSFFELVNANGEWISCSDGNGAVNIDAAVPGTQHESCEGSLAAGTYWVHVGIGNSEYPGTGVGEPLPAHFKAQYTLTIVTE